MMTERIEETALRCTISGHAWEKWQYVRVARGWEVRAWFDVNAMPDAERAEYEAAAEQPEAPEGPQETAPIWPTLALAKAYADLCDFHDNIAEDCRAFDAPSECYDHAYASFARRYDALMAQAVA